ncbi:hypothetical protein GWK63_15480 [Komagataeibacter rhaeticus]|uniref:Uncharacterized protein n=3 Tax=Komagataeibacter rhaeticus TaxID=215221 RepID=A0A858JHT6_9PROT|nr:hypothetical protein [Komagataeibacter rhaeticus]QIP36665.1 hypothetical protein GWK63_15480 [Komagataeibacter rhaeticus]
MNHNPLKSLNSFSVRHLEILVRMMLRGHWVRLSRDDTRGKRILDREDWTKIRSILEQYNFLEIKNLGAGGKPSEFVHLRKATEFLSLSEIDPEVRTVIDAINSYDL